MRKERAETFCAKGPKDQKCQGKKVEATGQHDKNGGKGDLKEGITESSSKKLPEKNEMGKLAEMETKVQKFQGLTKEMVAKLQPGEVKRLTGMVRVKRQQRV